MFVVRYFWRWFFIKTKELQLEINEKIFDREVRVIDANGVDLGVMPTSKALSLAYESGDFDLVKVGTNSVPPVCKIMNYGKFCFEKAKKEKEMRKNQRAVALKEIRLTVNIGENDMRIKANKVAEFIKNGDRVKVLIRFRGREQKHAEIGENVMNSFFDICSELCGDSIIMEKSPKQETRNMFMFLAPNSKTKKSRSISSRDSETLVDDVQSSIDDNHVDISAEEGDNYAEN